MLSLSADPKIAEQQMIGLIYTLTTFGYIDGDFDERERAYVRDYITRVITAHAATTLGHEAQEVRDEATERYQTHFQRVFERMDRQIQNLWHEEVPEGESQADFVRARLELRCYEIFKCFNVNEQRGLLATVDELLMADGVAHPEEKRFRQKLEEILLVTVDVDADPWSEAPNVVVGPLVKMPSEGRNHPFFKDIEVPYPAKKGPELDRILEADCAALREAMELLDAQRRAGEGRLAGVQSITEFRGQEGFLDGHVYVAPPTRDMGYELTVVGDLHGCYSCFKAALLQSKFFERVESYRRDPNHYPKPLIVFLGDYVDRGAFSFAGVVRGIVKLFTTYPDHVYLLRGNHEFYLEGDGTIIPAVQPADGLFTLQRVAPFEVQRYYKLLFDSLAGVLAFEQLFFVHGGIPKDAAMAERYTDLSSLNDPHIRLQMMWADPSSADAVPRMLQDQASRFPFGRLQAQAFLHGIGCHTMFRGHQKIDAGFARVFDDDQIKLFTIFSAGGETNDDLPVFSNYRYVTPKALTVRYRNGEVHVEPWDLDFETYNKPELNAFYQK